DRWTKVVQSGFGSQDDDAGRDAAKLIVEKMEAGFGDGPWLMGQQYTLADIDLMPVVDRIDEVYKDILNASLSPKGFTGLSRMRGRPNVQAVWATDEAPGSKAA